MSIPGSASPLFFQAAAADAAAFQIDRSLRFNAADSAYLSRAQSSGNTKTFTYSFWMKKVGAQGEWPHIIGADQDSNNRAHIRWNLDKLQCYFVTAGSAKLNLQPSRVFRDYGAWFHVVLAVDSTQTTTSNRAKLYINGELQSAFDYSTYPSQNDVFSINNSSATAVIGRRNYDSSNYINGYLADVHFVDGQALAATDFGEYDDNGVWQPKEFTGSYDQSAGGRTIANSNGAVPLLNTSDADGQTVSSGVRSDSNSSSIVLALPLNGSNGGTTITDYHHTIKGSGSAKAITLFSGSSSGGAVTSTAISRYYGSSFYAVRGGVNANQSDYITRTGDSDLNLGTGDFCVEFWFHPTSLDTNFVMFDNRHPTDGWPNSSDGFAIIGNGSGDIFLYHGGNQRINHSAKLTVNTWHHIAVTRDSGTERLFVDGDFFSSTYSSSNNYNESRFLLGSSAPNGEGSTGYFQDLRIYVGAAKYTSNFNVPVLGVGGVNSFYLKFDDNSSNAALGTDSSGLSNTYTVNNIAAQGSTYASAGTHQGKVGISFNGTNAEINLSADTDLNPGSGVFTLECYAYSNNNSSELGIYDGSPGGVGSFVLRRVGAGTLMVERHNAAFDITGAQFSQNTWHHVAVTRDSSNNVRLFVDGTQSGSTSTNNTHNYQGTFRLGRTNNAFTQGYISNLRLIKGTCLYTSNFTAPTGNLSNVTNTKLLMAQSTTSSVAATVKPSGVTISGSGDGTVIDSLIDTPTNGTQSDTGAGGEVSGNYATLNALDNNGTGTFSNGNLEALGVWANGSFNIRATIAPTSGKWYWEYTMIQEFGIYGGIVLTSFNINTTGAINGNGGVCMGGGSLYNGGSVVSSSPTQAATGDVMGFAWDVDNSSLEFFLNNVSQGTVSSIADGHYAPAVTVTPHPSVPGNIAANFGQRAFAYSAPSGYKALNTASISAATIADGSAHFQTNLWSGTGSSRSITTTGMSPDFVWYKQRNSSSYGHDLFDSVRGPNNILNTNNTLAQYTEANRLTAFNADGFSLGNSAPTNGSSGTYVGWAWNAGSSTVSNTDGSVTSSVRANQTAGFSIVTYTGNSNSSKTIGHGLNAAPEMIIIKCRNATSDWTVFHKSTGNNAFCRLNLTNSSDLGGTGVMGATSPTSSVFTVGDYSGTGDASRNFVAYCFAPVAGYSAFGSYTGNGSSDGPFVHTGFKVAWLMLKVTTTSDAWCIWDGTRQTFNVQGPFLQADAASAESDFDAVDILSNGFKLRTTGDLINKSAANFIYAAFAENPFQANGGLAR